MNTCLCVLLLFGCWIITEVVFIPFRLLIKEEFDLKPSLLWSIASYPLTPVFHSCKSTTADLPEYFSSRSSALRSLSDDSISRRVYFWTDNFLSLDFKSLNTRIEHECYSLCLVLTASCRYLSCIMFAFLYHLKLFQYLCFSQI